MTVETEALEQLWLAHYQQPLNATFYDDNASLSFMPTTAGANGLANIARFLAANSGLEMVSMAQGADGSRLVSRTFAPINGGDVHVAEEWAVSMEHGDGMQWLLPSVQPTRKNVVFPLIVLGIISAASRKIEQKKLYWDQATVLRQIGLLPSDVNRLPTSAARPVHAKIMPIATGYDQVARMIDQFSIGTGNKLAVDEEVDWAKPVASAQTASAQSGRQSFSAQKTSTVMSAAFDDSPPSPRKYAQHAGGKDSISFGDYNSATDKMADMSVRSSSRGRSRPRAVSNASDLEQEDCHKQMLANAAKNDSHFSFAHDGTPHLEQLSVHKRPGSSAQTLDHWMTGEGEMQQRGSRDAPMFPTEAPVYVKKYHNQSQLTLGGDGEPTSIWQSSSNGAGTVQSRPSSRVLNAPGGRSTFSFA